MTARDLVGVVIGATAGAGSRWALGELVGIERGLLVANVVGCLVIGWATTRRDPGPWLTAGWCGALTSFSAASLQVARDIDEGQARSGLGWLILTLLGCAGAFVVGRGMVPRVRRRLG